MSMPKRSTVFGEIEIDGQSYKILSRPVDDETAKKIHKYKTDGAGVGSSAPWMTDAYKWSILDNKLYLDEINIMSFDQELFEKLMTEAGEEFDTPIEDEDEDARADRLLAEISADRTLEEIAIGVKLTRFRVRAMGKKNMIQELFNTDKLFAEWQNKDIKLLLSQETNAIEDNRLREKVTMNLRVLKFTDGVLISTNDEIEEFTQRARRNYIEE